MIDERTKWEIPKIGRLTRQATLFVSTADDNIVNTAAKTSFQPTGLGSLSLTPGSMRIGQVYRITARGILSTA